MEAMTYTMTSLELIRNVYAEPHDPDPMPVHIANPMTVEQEYLRSGLRPNLLATLAANRRYEEEGIKLFEIGKIFIAKGNNLPAEPEMLCGLMNGNRAERSWLGGEGTFDFYDVKGLVEGLLKKLNVTVSFEKSDDEGLHPARQAAIVAKADKQTVKLGVLGELHPKVAARFEIEGVVGLFEISVEALLACTGGYQTYQQIPRFPNIVRDLALVVDADVTNQRITDIIKGFSLISDVQLFDVYSGKQVAAGKKSLAYRLVYQSPDQTLKDETVNKVQEKILEKLTKELGAILRG
jgi:phenylalanyl-tRNA synthetase beta chain